MKLETLALLLAAPLLLGVATPRAEAASSASSDEAADAPDARVRNVDVRKIVLRHGEADAPQTGLFVSRVQTDGEDAVTSLQVLGGNSAAIEIDDLADGETRSFDIGDGRWMDVMRDGDSLRIDLDGKEIVVPLNPVDAANAPELAGLHGTRKVAVFMMAGDEPGSLPGAHAQLRFVGEEGSVQHAESAESFDWHQDGGATMASRVIVRHLGAEGEEPSEARVFAMPALPLHGLAMDQIDFESLKSLEGVSPEVREKVIAALKEVLGRHQAIRLDIETDAQWSPAGERELRVRSDGASPASEVR